MRVPWWTCLSHQHTMPHSMLPWTPRTQLVMRPRADSGWRGGCKGGRTRTLRTQFWTLFSRWTPWWRPQRGTVTGRRRRVAVGGRFKPGREWPTDDQDLRDASKSPLRAGPTPADSALWWRAIASQNCMLIGPGVRYRLLHRHRG